MFLLFQSTSTSNCASTQEIDYIGRLAVRASRRVESYTIGYTLAQQVYSESLPSYGGRRLMLGQCPLVKVLRLFDSTATCDATAVCSSEYQVENYGAGLLSRAGGWRWTADQIYAETCFEMGLALTPRPGDVDRPWLVEYIAGYSITGTTSTATGRTTEDDTWTTGPTLPEDVVQATAMLAARMYANPLDIAERRVDDASVRYRYRGDQDKPEWQQILDPYVRSV